MSTTPNGRLNGRTIALVSAAGMLICALLFVALGVGGGPSASAAPSSDCNNCQATPNAQPSPTFVTQGAFSATGAMHTGRGWGQTATLLPAGRVLVSGGDGGSYAPPSAEIYDSGSGTFTLTGPMLIDAQQYSATTLDDGRVLFAGGQAPANPAGAGASASDALIVAGAEIYNPKTGTFSLTGSMSGPRVGQSATALSDGRVLIAGGADNTGAAVSSAEIYNPASGKFSPTGSMSVARSEQSATLLPDGRVLIAGGTSDFNTALSSAEIYDPASGQFSATGSLLEARYNQEAVSLADGQILLVGGIDVNETASAELYDPAKGAFIATGPMSTPRNNFGLVRLADGRILVAGGTDNSVDLASAEIYNPAKGAFVLVGMMSTQRNSVAAATLPDGRVLLAGGEAWNGNQTLYQSSAELYRP